MELVRRYTASDLSRLTDEETSKLIRHRIDTAELDVELCWQLLYRIEPELYDRLIQAEPLHPAILDCLPVGLDRIAEVGSGTGRLTLDLVNRAQHIIAVEPAAPLREILLRKLAHSPHGHRVTAAHGFFDLLPIPSKWADMVVTCSALKKSVSNGGDAGLREMERVCRPGGLVAIVLPNDVEWLQDHGYRYISFPGEVRMQFSSLQEAVEMARIFYPHAVAEVRRGGRASVPYEVMGISPPRDIAVKVMPT